jgi:hypothetical protein
LTIGKCLAIAVVIAADTLLLEKTGSTKTVQKIFGMNGYRIYKRKLLIES